jgi:hypothetical protein
MRRLALALILCGCDLLFPEFAGSKPNPSGSDGGSAPHIGGVLCALGDLRDYRTCGGITGSQLRVTVEETRDGASADGNGHFTLPLSKMLPTALLAGADGANSFAPTVTTVSLRDGSADGVAVPLFAAQQLRQVALQNGVNPDPQKGVILGWATDVRGTPLAGVSAQAPLGSDGPFYDGAAAGQVVPGIATQDHGLVAFFNVTAGDATFTLGQTRFQVPVRQNAVTFSLLVTAP